MKRIIFILLGVILLGGVVSSTEREIYSGGKSDTASYTCYMNPAPTELSYDNGEREYSICWYEGSEHWVGNDFDIAAYGNQVISMRIFTRKDWPDNKFNGFYIAIYDEVEGLPGSIIWPDTGKEKYVLPSSTENEVWAEFPVNATLSSSTIFACMEQYFDYPEADPYCVDTNPIPLSHSWEKGGQSGWKPLDTSDLGITHNNLMLRLVVNENKNIRNSSFGKIKALYK